MMRKLAFFLFVVSLALFRGQAHAQHCLPGMKGIRLTAGMADGFYSPSSKNETGYSFGASLATYTKGGNQWVFGAEYLRRYHPYRESRIPVEQFTGEGGFFCDVLSDGSKTFFLSAGVSAWQAMRRSMAARNCSSTALRYVIKTVLFMVGQSPCRRRPI